MGCMSISQSSIYCYVSQSALKHVRTSFQGRLVIVLILIDSIIRPLDAVQYIL